MEEVVAGGLSAIGLDWKALLFQVLNFAILLWVLKRFAYRPITRLLEARRQKIAESLKTAEDIARQKSAFAEERRQRLREVGQEAAVMLAESKREAAALIQAAGEKGQETAAHLRAQAAARQENEAQQLRASLKQETVSLVKRLTERVLNSKLDDPADEQLIKQALQDLS